LSAIKTLGSYFSANNEVDLEALTDMRLKKNLLTTFPRVEPNHSMSLIAPKNFKNLSKINIISSSHQTVMKYIRLIMKSLLFQQLL
jgi:5-formyltetrahydrofolate cyclo-ligase